MGFVFSGDFLGSIFTVASGLEVTVVESEGVMLDFEGERVSGVVLEGAVVTVVDEAAAGVTVTAGVGFSVEVSVFLADEDLSVSCAAARLASRGSIIRGFSTFSTFS